MKKILYLGDAASPHVVKFLNHFCRSFETYAIHLGPASRAIDGCVTTFALPRFYGNKADYLLNIPDVRRITREISPDLVHAHYASSYGLLASIAGTTAPLVISAWGTDVTEFPYLSRLNGAVAGRTIGRADAIFATSRYLARAVEKLGASPAKVSLTPFGIDASVFRPRPRPERVDGRKRFRLFLAKNFEKYYNHAFLFEITRFLSNALPGVEVSLGLAGAGPLEPEYRRLVVESGMSGSVEFLGKLDQAGVAGELAGTDLAIMPSIEESYGVFALEAQACGVPVIASLTGGVGEVILHGLTGFVFPLSEKGRFFEAALALARNGELRTAMGEKAAAFARNNFSVERCMRRVEDLYDGILRRHTKQ